MDNNYRPWAVCRLGQVITRYHHRAEAEMEVQRLNRLVITGFFYVENQSLEISKKKEFSFSISISTFGCGQQYTHH